MNIQSDKNKSILVILIGAIAILLIYSIDIFQLNYRLTGWESFGETPVSVDHLQYFMADTPNVIGYREPDSGETVSCAEAIAFVETDLQASYRCCDTGERISCLAGDFSSDIPAANEECVHNLREIFGIPASLAGTKDYKIYGSCPDGGEAEVTIVQLNDNGQILWKSVNATRIAVAGSALRCILGPLLSLLVIRTIVVMFQRKKTEPIRRI